MKNTKLNKQMAIDFLEKAQSITIGTGKFKDKKCQECGGQIVPIVTLHLHQGRKPNPEERSLAE